MKVLQLIESLAAEKLIHSWSKYEVDFRMGHAIPNI